MLSNIPEELKKLDQWCVWKAIDLPGRDKPTKKPFNALTDTSASPTDPATWCSYEKAVQVFEGTGYYHGIGFVLSANDPYTFIDLDATDCPQEQALQQQIYNAFPSYAELSPSGKGLHIICKGTLPHGKRKGAIELYSAERYMTMTGNVYRAAPIVDCQELLSSLFEHLGGIEAPENVIACNYAQTIEDEEVIRRAASASNAAKFIDLLNGHWQGIYQSQSEADFAFVDILSFYTDNKEQVARIFRSSKLGERDKKTSVKGVPYIEHMVNRSFDRKLPPVDTTALSAQIETAIKAKAEQEHKKPGRPKSVGKAIETNPYSVPPGLVGRIADFIYRAAPRPVPEIALAGAIGFVAGMAGRAYNISGTGLNQYVLLLAKTGTGKEAIGAGISALISEAKKFAPTISEFMGPTVIASPQALIKKLSKHRSFVSIMGEFGLRLQQMTARNATAADRGVMTALLDLFNKSGKGAIFGAMAYSDSDKNVDSIESPALSLLGESTPESFYEGIDESSIKSGLVPRFTVIEYKGDRPDLNKHRACVTQCPQLVDELAKFAAQCAMLNHQGHITQVLMTPEAEKLFEEYNLHADNCIRGSDDVSREIWNRAHIKALKMAALLAVGVNWLNPCVTEELALWSINVENLNIRRLIERFESGEVGQNIELARQDIVFLQQIKKYLVTPFDDLKQSYKKETTELLHKDKVIPYGYMIAAIKPQRCFGGDRSGQMFKATLQNLIDSGMLQEVRPIDQLTKYNKRGRLFVCVDINILDK